MHRPFRPMFCLLVALILVSVSARAQDLYVITLDRVRAAGQEFNSTLVVVEDTSIQVFEGDKLVKSDTTASKKTLTGIAKVLRVDETGNIQALTYKVEECSREDNGTVKKLLRTGQLLAMFNNPEGVTFTVDGLPVADEVLYDSLMDLLKPDDTARLDRVDAKIGVDRPVRVGEAWAMQPGFVEALLEPSGLEVAPEAIKSRCKFTGVGELNGEAATTVDMTVLIDLSHEATETMPKMKGAMKIQVVYLQPIAGDAPSQRFRLQMQTNTLMTVPPAQQYPAGRKVVVKAKYTVQDDLNLIAPVAATAAVPE